MHPSILSTLLNLLLTLLNLAARCPLFVDTLCLNAGQPACPPFSFSLEETNARRPPMDRGGFGLGREEGRKQSASASQTTPNPRRLAATGSAFKLKNKALIEAQPPLTRVRVCSPEPFNPDQQNTSTPDRTPDTAVPPEPSDAGQGSTTTPDQDPGTPGPSETSEHPSRKRRMSTDQNDDGKRQKEDNCGLLSNIKALIDGSERRTVSRFDKRIGELSNRLDKRLEATEKDVKRAGRAIKELKGETIALNSSADNDRAELPALINRIVGEKIAAIQTTAPASQRLRPLTPNIDNKADKYWEPRRSLFLLAVTQR